jgi:uncharacterized protein (DUF2249 family)
MAKSAIKKIKHGQQPEFVADPNHLLKAILRAVGKLQPGEGLEIRRVRDPKLAATRKPKKKRATPRGALAGKP